MGNLAQSYYVREKKVEDSKVLIIHDNLSSIAKISEKCIAAGVLEDNISHCTSVYEISDAVRGQKYTHVIICAKLYNFFVFDTLEKLSKEGEVAVFIYHDASVLKTIRLITDEKLTHITDETGSVLLKSLFCSDVN